MRLLLLAFAALLCAAAEPVLERRGGALALRGWNGEGCPLRVFVDQPEAPPALGSCRREGDVLVFEPRFPFRGGVRYRAEAGSTIARLTWPAEDLGPPAQVTAVYPSGDVLPENLLKFYVSFSAPMARGEAYRQVRLLDAKGDAVADPFLELEQELWNAAGTRLTLLLDPGRIKRDLAPNREVGLALREGERYTLEIGQAWMDAHGRPMREAFRKTFSAGKADRTPPQIEQWRVVPPRAGTRDPLLVEFPEPLDRALLEHLIRVGGYEGEVRAGGEETRWEFVPDRPWTAGVHKLLVDTAIEDRAGNRINRPFDVDLWEKVGRQLQREIRELPFTVR